MNKITKEQIAFNILKITLDSPSRPCLKHLRYDLQDDKLRQIICYCYDRDCKKHYEAVREYIEM